LQFISSVASDELRISEVEFIATEEKGLSRPAGTVDSVLIARLPCFPQTTDLGLSTRQKRF
jgi:hypothetical protein